MENIKETDCIVLVGGQGTRLRSVVSEVPKPMAPVNGNPFLRILLDYLHQQGMQHFILATGYKTESIRNYFSSSQVPYIVSYSEEKEPLGTGGAIMQALKKASSDKVLIVNGDTFFKMDLPGFISGAIDLHQHCVLALKKIFHSDRYGSVQLSGTRIVAFEEKQFKETALINAGVYLLDKKWFLKFPFADRFSFEKDYLEKYAELQELSGIEMKGYFIDIGIPEDYEKAQHDFEEIANR